MYPNYFGLKEYSFSIAPDPRYLFLSEQHQEALVHLLYGAGENGGFVLLTGEVGTGKTTVCRTFLEQLPDGVEVALIINPALTAAELLRAICDEFRVPVPAGERSIKGLVDALNRYLLEAHAQGRRPVLIIDEAQSLRPNVLEQVRLLTNLETNRHKLLQIFLIGQPELRRMLDSPGLRQINQRITARFHLRPLTAAETVGYVRHRLAVAGVDRPLFNAAALGAIHRISGGIPRLINILCDRCLLGACVTRRPQVTPAIVRRAAREVLGQPQSSIPWARRAPALAASVFVVAVAIGWGVHLGWPWFERVPERLGSVPLILPPVAVTAADSPGAGDLLTEARLGHADATVNGERDPVAGEGAVEMPGDWLAPEELAKLALPEAEAVRVLLRRWGVDVDTLGAGDPCARVASFGLRCERERGDLSDLLTFDRPAPLRIRTGEGAGGFLVLGQLEHDIGVIDLADGERRVRIEDLETLLTGDYLLIWQPPPVGSSVIGPTASGDSVRWLRRLLSEAVGAPIGSPDSGRFDAGLAQALRQFQISAGLAADGIAGPRTLIRLDNAVAMPGVPRLSRVEPNPNPDLDQEPTDTL